MTRGNVRPPRLAEWFLAIILPREIGAELLADLGERYAQPGRAKPRLWYWGQVARVCWPLTLFMFYRLATDVASNPQHDIGIEGRGMRSSTLEAVVADVRYAIRRAHRRVGFTVIAVVSLGLGIGINTAAFSLISAVMFHKTPVTKPDRVLEIYKTRGGQLSGPLAYPDYADLRRESHNVFSQVSASKLSLASREMGDHVESLIVELVNGDYFPLMGLAPPIGRLFGPEDDVAQGAHPVVVISNDYWRREFAGSPAVIGRQLRLSGTVYTVVGVAPSGIQGLVPGLAPALYVPVQMTNLLEPTLTDQLAQRGTQSYFVKARLADGQSVAAATAVVTRFADEMKRSHPEQWTTQSSLRVIPTSAITVNPLLDKIVIPAAGALMVVVGLVLIVACANLASFLLAQARDRQREIAIRLAIGASRRVLVRQLLIESVLLALIGGAFGILLANVALRALLHADLPLPLPINLDARLDARVLTFALAASVAAGVLFGLLPALQATRQDIVETIKSDHAGARRRKRFAPQSGLVVAQVAMSLLLLITASLFLRSFAAQSNVSPGFGSAPAGMVWMAIPPSRYPGDRSSLILAEIERRMRLLPDVDGVGVIDNMMLNALNHKNLLINVDGFRPPPGERGFDIACASADSGFFDAVGVTIVAGRGLRGTDTPNAPRVAVVNEQMARRFWPRGAIGQTFHADGRTYAIVGVSRTTKVNSLGEEAQPLAFLAIAQVPSPDFTLIARTRGSAEHTATAMLAELRALDPSLMIIQAKTMSRHLAALVLPARLGALAFAAFSGLALILSIIGVYGVVRHAVTRRRREMAIRLAVGASPASLVRMMMKQGLALVVGGTVVGLALGIFVARALQSLLYGVDAIDPLSLFGAPMLLMVTGAVAALLPARGASTVDPATTLRSD